MKNKLRTVYSAIRVVWSSKEIKARQEHLADLRTQLTTATLAVLWCVLSILHDSEPRTHHVVLGNDQSARPTA